MPFIHSKPWRAQFFDHIRCPESVIIPTEDPDAWSLCPDHRWVYNKLAIALSQGLDAAPHYVMPPKSSYPVFSKPITNLQGMGVGSRVIPDEATFLKAFQPGHFWCALLWGRHVSTDAAVVDGEMVWCRHSTGVPISDGMFDYWHIHKEAMPEIEGWFCEWARTNLAGYTGMVNFETMGGRMIEFHLRFAPQWPDLYGERWLDAVVRLYSDKHWDFNDSDRTDKFSIILWGSQQRFYRHPSASDVAKARAVHGVLNVQISFCENVDFSTVANPPGGYRLAVVNCTELGAGRLAVKILQEAIVNKV